MTIIHRVVHKFPLDRTLAEQVIGISFGCKIRCLQLQGQTPTIWAEVYEGSKPEPVTIYRRFTGEPLGAANTLPYVGTVQFDNGIVAHYYAERTH